jgi:hypothetical protein
MAAAIFPNTVNQKGLREEHRLRVFENGDEENFRLTMKEVTGS